MRLLATVTILAISLLPVMAQAKKKDEVPPVDRAAIHASLKKVGMMPMRVAGIVPNAGDVARRYEAAVAGKLRAAGFEVVEADAMRQIQAALGKAMGGLYDPVTGEATKEKIDARTKFARSEYLATHKVDGFVYLSIVHRDAEAYSMKARWDGVEERVTGQGAFKSIMSAGGALGDGVVPALSLAMVLEDRDGKDLYGRYGGLQLLSYLRMGWVPKYHDVDPAHLLTDPARDERALALVFDPLTGEKSGAEKAKLTLAPTASGEEQGALRVPREDVLGRKRVAVASLAIGDIGQRDEVRARYAGLLKQRLSAAGLEVAEDADFDRLWEEKVHAAGGFHDPITGQLDTSRHHAARLDVLRELAATHGVKAVVFPSIAIRDASYASGVVKWDGAEQVVSGGGSKLGAMFGAGGRYVGRLQALSLEVRIADLDDATLFEDYGGIQSLTRFEHGRFVDLPVSQLFSEPERDTAAVALAFGEITGKPANQRGR